MSHNIRYAGFIMIFISSVCYCQNNLSDLHKYISDLEQSSQPAKTNEKDYLHLKKKPDSVDPNIKSPFPQKSTELTLSGKQPLENYSLDAIHLLGIVAKKDYHFGIVKMPDNKIYHVFVGSIIGKNNGRVTSITKDKIIIKVPNSPSDTEKFTLRELRLNSQGRFINEN